MKTLTNLLVFCLFPLFLYGQTAFPDVAGQLERMGMENVAVAENDFILRVAYDDPVSRNNSQGAFDVIQTLLSIPEVDTRVHIILMHEQIPQVLIQLPEEAIRQYRNGTYTLEDVMRTLTIGHDAKTDMEALKGAKKENSSFGKIDLVFYPQATLQNAWLDKLYGVAIDIAPAVEVGLWKGASFTGQAIFPVWNNMTGQMDYIRAGMLLFRQQYHLLSKLYTTFSIGNFNRERIGADVQVKYRPDNGLWGVGAQVGLTGSSTFYQGKWEVTRWKRLSGNAYVQYHLPYYNMDFNLAVHRYVFEDYGVRMDCSRHFGEVTVGVYAMRTGGEYNGGFHCAIPLYPKKLGKRKAIRVRAPKYFDLEYEAQSGNEYAARRLGRYYEVRPDENRSQFYYNPAYMKSYLINLSREEK